MARPTLYAHGTKVDPVRTREQIERLVTNHGAVKFVSGWDLDCAMVEFVTRGRRVRFRVQADNCTPAELRRRWRSLYLAIRSRLDAVESGIETFDEAFLSHIVNGEGKTVGDWMRDQGARLLGPMVE